MKIVLLYISNSLYVTFNSFKDAFKLVSVADKIKRIQPEEASLKQAMKVYLYFPAVIESVRFKAYAKTAVQGTSDPAWAGSKVSAWRG